MGALVINSTIREILRCCEANTSCGVWVSGLNMRIHVRHNSCWGCDGAMKLATNKVYEF